MPSKIFRISLEDREKLSNFFNNELGECLLTLKKGGMIVYPTETLYGLGVDITNYNAISRLIELKRRPKNLPISVAVANKKQAEQLVDLSEFAERIIEHCLPKPVTILLPAKDSVSRELIGGSDLLGLRFPENPVTIEILKKFGPLTATSANLHGDIDPVSIDSIMNQFGDRVDMFIDTGPCRFGKPSTVIDVTDGTIRIIRDGACSGNKLEDCLRGC